MITEINWKLDAVTTDEQTINCNGCDANWFETALTFDNRFSKRTGNSVDRCPRCNQRKDFYLFPHGGAK